MPQPRTDNRAVPPDLRPHRARYTFVDARGHDAGEEVMTIARRPGGWIATSHLELTLPDALASDIEWHLEPDLSTHVIYMSATDHWGQEYYLEAAVTGNGLIASRQGAEGPTQVEMGWGPDIELDHISACFATVLLARWDSEVRPRRQVTSVYIPADDLLPEPLQQEYRVVERSAAVTLVERLVPATGSRAEIAVGPGGIVQHYAGLFRLAGEWAYTDEEPPTK
jgi:hypothetical protein